MNGEYIVVHKQNKTLLFTFEIPYCTVEEEENSENHSKDRGQHDIELQEEFINNFFYYSNAMYAVTLHYQLLLLYSAPNHNY